MATANPIIPTAWAQLVPAGAACLLSGFDMHGEIDAFGSAAEYVK